MPSEEQTHREFVKHMLTDMKSDICDVKLQTTKTNGRVTRLEKIMLTAGAATIMYIAIKAPELFSVIKAVI